MTETGDSSKKDTGKARYDLIPPEPLDALAELYGIGAAKYADRGWESGMKWGRIFAAMMRHSWKWWRGEKYDPVDGQHHLTAVAWCAFALYTYETRKDGEDDRSRRPVPLSPRIEESLNAIEARTPACPDLDQELPLCSCNGPCGHIDQTKVRCVAAGLLKPVPGWRKLSSRDFDVMTGQPLDF